MTAPSDTMKVPGEVAPGSPAGLLASPSGFALAGLFPICKYCGSPVFTHGLCNLHYQRFLYGIPMDQPVRVSANTTITTYKGIHSKLRRLWGAASWYLCVECPERARDWAYNHKDPNEMMDTFGPAAGLLFSPSVEFYLPLCGECHRALDGIGVNYEWD